MSKTISIDLTEEQLQKIREAGLLPSEKKGQWRPGIKEEYWAVHSGGIVSRFVHRDGRIDNFLRDSGNMFKTVEEAYNHRSKLLAINRINRYCWDNWYFEPDWENNGEAKYSIYYNHYVNKLDLEVTYRLQYGSTSPFLPSEDAAEDVIANCKDDLLTVFGVK